MLVDSHCHLDYDDYSDEGLEVIVARAQTAGIGRLLTISTQLSKFPEVLAVAEKFPNVYCSVGTHPHHGEEDGEKGFTASDIAKLTSHPKVVGIGETGLDYYYGEFPTRAGQRTCFEKHIEAAVETDIPLIIHTRDAEDDTIDILNAYKGKVRGVIHCFSGTAKLAQAAIGLGFYVSASGIITFKKSDEIRAALKDVPLERLLVETDCPYLSPVPHRGKRNEPAFVKHTAMALSEIKGVDIDVLHEATTKNFFDLFNKVK